MRSFPKLLKISLVKKYVEIDAVAKAGDKFKPRFLKPDRFKIITKNLFFPKICS